MKLSEFSKIIAGLSLAFNEKLEPERISIYYEFLGNYDYELLKKVFQELIQTEKYFPAIATIKRLIIDEIYDIPTEADVINDLFSRISSTGIYGNPTFEYPITNALVEELDWKTICNMTPEDVIKSIHFRYTSVSNHYETCLLRGENFPINKIKGLFAEIERKPFLKNGNNVFRQVVDNIEIKEISDV